MKNNNHEFRLIETKSNHWYFIKNEDFPSGVEMPSSTNILEVFPNVGLNYWKENTSPEEIKKKQEEGKNQGSKVHHTCYLLSIGKTIYPSNGLTKEQIIKLPLETSEDKKKDDKLLNYLRKPFTDREYKCIQSFQNFWEEFKPISSGREMKVYHKKLLYAGTLDWAGYLYNSKKKKYEFWIIDYKISNTHDRSYEAQIISYLKALNQMYGKNFKAKLGLLYLGKSIKKMFQLKEIDNKKRAWNDFILAKKLWHTINLDAKPDIKKKFSEVSIDVSYKTKGRLIKFNKQH